MECWKFIEGLDGRYEISDQGRVRYLGSTIKFQATTVKGYKEVRIKFKGKKYILKVHRLVAKNFVENPKGYDDVHHKNGIKGDNRSENLEWIDHREHTKLLGGFNHYMNKIKKGDDLVIKALYLKGHTQKSISKMFEIDPSVISRIVNDKINYLKP